MRFEPARYYDKRGIEDALIESDGRGLILTVRGVRFEGRSFDSLSIIQDESNLRHPSVVTFSLRGDDLVSYSLECCIPITVQVDGKMEQAQLQMRLGTEFMTEKMKVGGYTDLELELIAGHTSYKARSKEGWFEESLIQLKSMLPPNVQLICCFNCAFSDYSPYGNGMFGDMACFRDNKGAYLGVEGKGEIFDVWDTMTEFVQETYLCSEFYEREPNTGYRG